MTAPLTQFYMKHLPDGVFRDSILKAACPFCRETAEKKGKIIVFLKSSSFFYGYFRCSSGCAATGFQHWFARLARLDPATVPGLPEEEGSWGEESYPQKNINGEVDDFSARLADEELNCFSQAGISRNVLEQLRIGYNGRYLVYPYFQQDGNCYSARCVHPEREDDHFWYGDAEFAAGPGGLFNIEEIHRCAGGTLFLCEGEENLLAVKKLGFPGVAYHERNILETVDPQVFSSLKTILVIPRNTAESFAAARRTAAKIGFKVRILTWNPHHPANYSLRQLALESGANFSKNVGEMIAAAKPFSPFVPPEREWRRFMTTLSDKKENQYSSRLSGFDLLDRRIGGIHGINILGGGPKVGKSSFMIQIATEMAARHIPILYYDFENGRQRVYQRTFSRLCRLETDRIDGLNLDENERQRHEKTSHRFEEMLQFFRVVNDRKLTPELMRRHIDFLRHETRNEYSVVVIDSLHKLPFKDLSEMRTGIDSWLRQMESMRDELNVSFLVVSELSRGDAGSYGQEPHMGLFKGSGDIEYSADNALVFLPMWDHMQKDMASRENRLWLVASREHSPGLVARYVLDYPYWGFEEKELSEF